MAVSGNEKTAQKTNTAPVDNGQPQGAVGGAPSISAVSSTSNEAPQTSDATGDGISLRQGASPALDALTSTSAEILLPPAKSPLPKSADIIKFRAKLPVWRAKNQEYTAKVKLRMASFHAAKKAQQDAALSLVTASEAEKGQLNQVLQQKTKQLDLATKELEKCQTCAHLLIAQMNEMAKWALWKMEALTKSLKAVTDSLEEHKALAKQKDQNKIDREELAEIIHEEERKQKEMQEMHTSLGLVAEDFFNMKARLLCSYFTMKEQQSSLYELLIPSDPRGVSACNKLSLFVDKTVLRVAASFFIGNMQHMLGFVIPDHLQLETEVAQFLAKCTTADLRASLPYRKIRRVQALLTNLKHFNEDRLNALIQLTERELAQASSEMDGEAVTSVNALLQLLVDIAQKMLKVKEHTMKSVDQSVNLAASLG